MVLSSMNIIRSHVSLLQHCGWQCISDTAITGVKFFEEVKVTDPDGETRVYHFSLASPQHCACFNIGEGPDGSPLISWSDLVALYRLADGTTWAEHGTLYDAEDLVPPCYKPRTRSSIHAPHVPLQ